MRDMSVIMCPHLPKNAHLLLMFSKVITSQKQFPARRLRTSPFSELNITRHIFKEEKNGLKNDQQNGEIIETS